MSFKSLQEVDQELKQKAEEGKSLDAPLTKYEYVENITSSSVAMIEKYFNRNKSEYVAIKVFEDKEMDALREIRILKEISNERNEFCLYLIESFCVKNKYYIVTPLHGLSIANYLVKNVLDKTYVRVFSKQLIQAVDFLHQHNIVHTDVKPTNIVLSSLKNDLEKGIKLIDLGNAEKEEELKKENEERKFITKDFRSPEIALSLSLDRNVDIWSIGCVVYRMFKNKKIIKVKESRPNRMINRRIVEQARSLCPNGSEDMIEKSSESFKAELEEPKNSYQEKFEASFDLTDDYEKLLSDLLKRMLQFDPHLRISTEDALKHKFFL